MISELRAPVPGCRRGRLIHLVIRSAVLAGLAATGMSQASTDEVVSGEVARKVDREMLRLADHGFAGAVLVAMGGKIVLAKGYGLADRAAKRPFSRGTVFDMGSITKPFTAGAILKLESQGELKFTNNLSQYFDAVPADKREITLHQLLTHTAGFQHSLGDDYKDRTTRDEYVKLALSSKLIHAPGTKYAYSNIGYSLLGAIIERVSGKGYESYLRESLLLPAAMAETGYVLPNWDRERITHTYSGDTDYGTPRDRPWAPDGPYWHLRCNGGLLTTVDDLYRWHVALKRASVLPLESVKKYTAPHVVKGPQPESYYAYGWVVLKTPRGTRLIHHDGGDGIFSSKFRRYVDDDVVIIWTTNDIERTEAASAALNIAGVSEWLEQLVFE